MVRLKDSRRALLQRRLPVSIPYGTIKSQREAPVGAVLHRFQFHMVRLKDRLPRLEVFVLQFQFHMVRLKDFGRNGVGRGVYSFNSIWYD